MGVCFNRKTRWRAKKVISSARKGIIDFRSELMTFFAHIIWSFVWNVCMLVYAKEICHLIFWGQDYVQFLEFGVYNSSTPAPPIIQFSSARMEKNQCAEEDRFSFRCGIADRGGGVLSESFWPPNLTISDKSMGGGGRPKNSLATSDQWEGGGKSLKIGKLWGIAVTREGGFPHLSGN